ncbi:hypothetical protein OF376_00455 [Ureaplasma miroungigenitalium]|uniref:Uncharacterized protein n=1 Tax=Ureaplasma miroungigenitalium TaxID=1042321 RepID=A0ABT3BLX6_9BACT|nr:hypothetical protein [Ureaplasma miroungigenitalium]MCV3728261.1 hypothetical protein [Ureaplasma miroungigenitalium]MCV3734066.1 hypothetical protein [Ureaplasma miroungigenitalium]
MSQNVNKPKAKQNYSYNRDPATKKHLAGWIIFSIFIFIFLVGIAVLIAFIADFYIYENTNTDGLIWTVDQRAHGLLGYFNK